MLQTFTYGEPSHESNIKFIQESCLRYTNQRRTTKMYSINGFGLFLDLMITGLHKYPDLIYIQEEFHRSKHQILATMINCPVDSRETAVELVVNFDRTIGTLCISTMQYCLDVLFFKEHKNQFNFPVFVIDNPISKDRLCVLEELGLDLVGKSYNPTQFVFFARQFMKKIESYLSKSGLKQYTQNLVDVPFYFGDIFENNRIFCENTVKCVVKNINLGLQLITPLKNRTDISKFPSMQFAINNVVELEREMEKKKYSTATESDVSAPVRYPNTEYKMSETLNTSCLSDRYTKHVISNDVITVIAPDTITVHQSKLWKMFSYLFLCCTSEWTTADCLSLEIASRYNIHQPKVKKNLLRLYRNHSKVVLDYNTTGLIAKKLNRKIVFKRLKQIIQHY